MEEKKEKDNWDIALSYFGGVAWFGWLLGLLVAIIVVDSLITSLNFFGLDILGNQYLMVLVCSIIWGFLMWWGVSFSTGQINKRFIIKNKNKVAFFALTYCIVFIPVAFIFVVLGAPIASPEGSYDYQKQEIVRLSAFKTLPLMIGLFYILSMKYLKNTEELGNSVSVAE